VKHGKKTLSEASAEFSNTQGNISMTSSTYPWQGEDVGNVAGQCPVLNPSSEEQLVNHIKEMQRLLFGLTSEEVRRIAFQLAD